jgi:hypothetical protein
MATPPLTAKMGTSHSQYGYIILGTAGAFLGAVFKPGLNGTVHDVADAPASSRTGIVVPIVTN